MASCKVNWALHKDGATSMGESMVCVAPVLVELGLGTCAGIWLSIRSEMTMTKQALSRADDVLL